MAALEPREVEIPLTGGMNTKQGAELQSMDTLRSVVDLHWNAQGELEKRPAVVPVATVTLPFEYGVGNVGVYAGVTAAAIVESRGEVYTITGEYGAMNESQRYSGAGDDYVSSGQYPVPTQHIPKSCAVSRLTIGRCSATNQDQGFAAFASCPYGTDQVVTAAVVRIASGFGCLLRLRALNILTGAVIAELQIADDVVGATSWAVDACECSSGAVITFASGAAAPYTITKYRYRAAYKDFVADTAISVTAATVRHRIVRGLSGTDQFIIAFQNNTGVLYAGTYDIGAATTLVSAHIGLHTATGGTDIVIDGSNVLIVSATVGVSGVVYAERYGTPATYITLRTLSIDELVVSVTAAAETASAITSRAAVFISVFSAPASPYNYRMDCCMVNFAATTCVEIASEATLYDHCTAVARAVSHGGRAYVLATAGQVSDTSAMWLRHFQPELAQLSIARPIARVAHDVLGRNNRGYTSNLSSAFVVGDVIHASLLTEDYGEVMPTSGENDPQTVMLSKVDLEPKPLSYAQRDGIAEVAGGVLFELDGDGCTFSQPFCRPEITVESSAAGTTTLATGISIVAVYRWVDGAGREHRSAPSAAGTVGVITNKQINVYVSELPFSPYDYAGHYSTDLYATADGGSAYYMTTILGAKHTGYTTTRGHRYFADVRAGASTGLPLYSSGDDDDELVSEPPPAFQAIATIGDRMFAIDAEDRTRIWFSKPFSAGYASEWNTANTLSIGDSGVGIADVNGVPTVFSQRGIWQVFGEGPNANGVGSFSPARRLPHEVECLDGLSVCKTPIGVFFRGRRGVYLLDAGLALQPIGLAVDSSFALSGRPTGFCKISYDELSNEVHVLDFDGTHYVFNLLEGKWSVWSNNSSDNAWIDSLCANGRLYFLHDNSVAADQLKRCYSIDESSYNAQELGWELTTPWLRFDGATGEHRVWKVIVQLQVGASESGNCGGGIEVIYTTRDGDGDTFTWTATQIHAEKNGNEPCTVNLVCHITHQRTRQFQLYITENTAGYPYTGSKPIAVRVLYGVTPKGSSRRSVGQAKGGTQAA